MKDKWILYTMNGPKVLTDESEFTENQESKWPFRFDHVVDMSSHNLLKQQCAMLREALEYYGDVSTWSLTEGSELRTIGEEDLELCDEAQPMSSAKGTYIAGVIARDAIKAHDEYLKGVEK